MALRIHKVTDVGLVRENNEDSIKTFTFSHCGRDIFCLAVADGVGGHQAGDVASKLAVLKLEELLKQEACPEELDKLLYRIIKKINKYVYRQSQLHQNYDGMGTTLTVALIDSKELIIGHVGDSRAYQYSDNVLKCITSDHSLVGELVKNGQLSREEARNHPRRNIILQAIGLEEDVEVDIYTEKFGELDILLLCTDGLSDLVSESEILNIFNGGSDQREILSTLKDMAVSRGAHDNFSIITAHRVGE